MPAPATAVVAPLERWDPRKTSRWGWRGQRYHHGIDLYGVYGSPVFAIAPGVVERVWRNGEPGAARYGNLVLISHPQLGVRSLYAHLLSLAVRADQPVAAGTLVGTMGNTAGTTEDPDHTFEVSAPHLHFEILRGSYPASAGPPQSRTDTATPRSMDPIAFMRAQGVDLTSGEGSISATGGLFSLAVLAGLGYAGWRLLRRRR